MSKQTLSSVDLQKEKKFLKNKNLARGKFPANHYDSRDSILIEDTNIAEYPEKHNLMKKKSYQDMLG